MRLKLFLNVNLFFKHIALRVRDVRVGKRVLKKEYIYFFNRFFFFTRAVLVNPSDHKRYPF